MDSGRLIFDSSTSHHGHMLVLDGGNSIFREGARSVLGVEDATNKRRPFFTSPEELLEEEYYDEQLPEKKRRLSPEQVHLLEKSFESENKLEPERKSELAKKLGLQPRQVAVWFQNRRARWRTKQLELDFDRLKAAYDSLLADHHSVSKDNDRLRSLVITLTEKIQSEELVAPGTAAESSVVDRVTSLEFRPKVEDRVSMGSGGSAVVDGEEPQQIADSSGDSYFHHHTVEAPSEDCGRVHSEEEEDGSDDASYNYVPNGMFITESQHADNWWVWS